MNAASPVFRFRVVMGFFIIALVISGLTAFPLLTELRILNQILNPQHIAPAENSNGLLFWVDHVYHGLDNTYQHYPWIAYGTDWLAFAHIIIAIFFIGTLIDPLSSRWILISGITACILVIPLALICGAIRGIPFYWRLIDCSFGIFGILPLLYCLKLRNEIERQAQCHPLS